MRSFNDEPQRKRQAQLMCSVGLIGCMAHVWAPLFGAQEPSVVCHMPILWILGCFAGSKKAATHDTQHFHALAWGPAWLLLWFQRPSIFKKKRKGCSITQWPLLWCRVCLCRHIESYGPMADSSLKSCSSDNGAHSCIGLRASAAASVISEGKHVYKQKSRLLNGCGHGAGCAHAAILSCIGIWQILHPKVAAQIMWFIFTHRPEGQCSCFCAFRGPSCVSTKDKAVGWWLLWCRTHLCSHIVLWGHC